MTLHKSSDLVQGYKPSLTFAVDILSVGRGGGAGALKQDKQFPIGNEQWSSMKMTSFVLPQLEASRHNSFPSSRGFFHLMFKGQRKRQITVNGEGKSYYLNNASIRPHQQGK